jgi:L-alanine-DL-glutamate epimerase-like enolase superfamily enzyme
LLQRSLACSLQVARVPEAISGESEEPVSRIAYVKTYQVAYPLDRPLSDSIHYVPVRAALLVELGTDDGEVGIGASAGFYAEGKDAEGLADEARRYVEAGFRHVKIKVGRTTDTPVNPLVHMDAPEFATVTLAEDLRRVGAVRKAIGDDAHLMVDANNAWTKPTALEAGREFERLGVHWFEEPVPTDDREGSAALAAAIDVPIALGTRPGRGWLASGTS